MSILEGGYSGMFQTLPRVPHLQMPSLPTLPTEVVMVGEPHIPAPTLPMPRSYLSQQHQTGAKEEKHG